MNYQFLKLPKLNFEEELLLGEYLGNWPSVDFFLQKLLNDNIREEILTLLPDYIRKIVEIDYGINVMTIGPKSNHNIHKDGRVYGLNYLLKMGGNKVTTLLYDDDKNLIESFVQPEHSWVLLNTHCNHTLDGITDNRIAITISFGGAPNFKKVPVELFKKLSDEYAGERI